MSCAYNGPSIAVRSNAMPLLRQCCEQAALRLLVGIITTVSLLGVLLLWAMLLGE